MIDENMERAHKRDAYYKEKFWFRTNILSRQNYKENSLKKSDYLTSLPIDNNDEEVVSALYDDFNELYIHEIL